MTKCQTLRKFWHLEQRWANSVLRTEYEYKYYSSSKKWPNTNTNIIRLFKTDRIRIRILFGLPKMTEYEYEYYSAPQKRPNTNIIRLSKNDRIGIRILMDSLKTQIIFIIGPESDHWLCLSLTHSLTDWLLFSKLDWCDPGVWRCLLKTCWGCYCCWC